MLWSFLSIVAYNILYHMETSGQVSKACPRHLYAWLLTLSFFKCSINTWYQMEISFDDQKKNPSWQNTCKLTSSVRTGAPPSPPLIPHDWLLCVWLGFTWKGSLTYVFQRNKKEPCTEGIGPGCHPALCQCILEQGTSSEAPVHKGRGKKNRFFLGNSPKQRTPPTHPYGLGLT